MRNFSRRGWGIVSGVLSVLTVLSIANPAVALDPDIIQQIQGAITQVVGAATSGSVLVTATSFSPNNYALKDKLTAYAVQVSARGYDNALLQSGVPIIYAVNSNGFTREQVQNAYGHGYMADVLKEPESLLKSWVTLAPLLLAGTKANTSELALAGAPIVFRTVNRLTLLWKKEDRNISSDAYLTSMVQGPPGSGMIAGVPAVSYQAIQLLKYNDVKTVADITGIRKPLLKAWKNQLAAGQSPAEILNVSSNFQPLIYRFNLYVPKGTPLTVNVVYLKTDYAKVKTALTLLALNTPLAEINKATGLDTAMITIWNTQMLNAVSALPAGFLPADKELAIRNTQAAILSSYSKITGTYESESYPFTEK